MFEIVTRSDVILRALKMASIVGIVRNSFPMLNTMDPLTFYIISLFWFLISIFISLKLINSPFGMSFQAIKQNEERVKSVGIETFKVKLLVFVISGTITGLAGSLYTDLNRFVSPIDLKS